MLNLWKAFGILKDIDSLPFSSVQPEIPDSRGTLAYEPVRAVNDYRKVRDDPYVQEIIHNEPFSYTPHEAATEAKNYLSQNKRPIFYVADDGHMVRFKSGDGGMEVDHVAHGSRAERWNYAPDGQLYHRDKIANDWLSHFKQHPDVSLALPLPGGLPYNRPGYKIH